MCNLIWNQKLKEGWRMVYKGPVWCWICTSFDTERWSGPSVKRSRSWNCRWWVNLHQISVFCWQSTQLLLTLKLRPHLWARCFQRIVNLYLSFINMVKLNTLWSYEGCSTNLEVLKIKMRLSETVCVMSPLLYIKFTKWTFHHYKCVNTNMFHDIQV